MSTFFFSDCFAPRFRQSEELWNKIQFFLFKKIIWKGVFIKNITNYEKNAKILRAIDKRKVSRKFHWFVAALKSRLDETVLITKINQVPCIKKYKFFENIWSSEINTKPSRGIDEIKLCRKFYWAETTRKYLKVST